MSLCTNRRIPLVNCSTWKLIRSPSLTSSSRTYIRTWACMTGGTTSIALSSTTTLSSTRKSTRYPQSSLILRNSTGIGFCRSNLKPLASISAARHSSYALSSKPGPSALCTSIAHPITLSEISFSCIVSMRNPSGRFKKVVDYSAFLCGLCVSAVRTRTVLSKID